MQSGSHRININLVFDFLKNIGPAELVIIVLVVGGLLGSQRIKKLAESLGESAKEIKKVKQELGSVKSDVIEAMGGEKSDV